VLPAKCFCNNWSAAWTTWSTAFGFGMSRRQARQFGAHGHIQVNGRKVNIPSYQVSVGEEIAIREGSKKLPILEPAKEFASHQNAPNWLEI